mgnify:CR=1 FL=1
MDIEQAKKRIEILRKEIDQNRYYYHVLDKPRVTDAVDDSLKRELFNLEQQFPSLVTSDSPTQRVGGEPLEKFRKVVHKKKMLSLNDAFTEEDLLAWQERLARLVGQERITAAGYYCELKMDGLAVSLKYKNGVLIRGATRGDGTVGEDVTNNLKTIESIPLKLREEGLKDFSKEKIDEIEIRGEVYLPKSEFEKLNAEQSKKGLPVYANPRNIAAGSIRQLDPKIAGARNLRFMMYAVATDLGLAKHSDEHELAKKLGFMTNPNNKICSNLEEVFAYIKTQTEKRGALTYQTDGIVVGINDEKLFNRLGTVGKAPRGQIAYKFPAEEATSVVKDIIIQVGRTGKLTPVAVLEPTLVDGSTVSRATLHNEDEIRRKDIKIGDTVIVHKAGDVIPEVVETIKRMRTGDEKDFVMPKECPICGGTITKKEGEVDWYCTRKNCAVREQRSLEHFVGKGAFEIEGLGPKILEKLISEGLISTPADIFVLTVGDLQPLERFGDKSASNLIREIEASKNIPLEKFLYALGIRHVGNQMAVDIAKQFASLENLLSAQKGDFDRMYGVGEKVSQSVFEFISDTKNHDLIKNLLQNGIKVSDYHSPVKSNYLEGKTFVVTGVLPTMTRDEMHKKIAQFGGSFSGSVSARTDYVIAGEDAGSKLEKAKKLSVKVISEKEFFDLVQ